MQTGSFLDNESDRSVGLLADAIAILRSVSWFEYDLLNRVSFAFVNLSSPRIQDTQCPTDRRHDFKSSYTALVLLCCHQEASLCAEFEKAGVLTIRPGGENPDDVVNTLKKQLRDGCR